ncbi:hypothetical protein N7510_011437 [Penicillium lagena]|uniref:uncharacterized protein n=1 Tax=Penicillium lagena TaxID=94218 RepID=UPI00254131AA|nr:uncharacterized protein N7510_011437 [Penicillium lagena]KAJ5601903.1 hypothetical protein N7510_011437 [Penicillium lagena]
MKGCLAINRPLSNLLHIDNHPTPRWIASLSHATFKVRTNSQSNLSSLPRSSSKLDRHTKSQCSASATIPHPALRLLPHRLVAIGTCSVQLVFIGDLLPSP